MITADKQAHLWAGAAIAAASLPFGIDVSLPMVLVAALGREIYNDFSGGVFDTGDVFATCIGGGLMCFWLTFV